MRKIMLRTRCYWSLSLIVCAAVMARPAIAKTQSDADKQLKQADTQCMQAKTPMQCREAVPACQRVATALEQRPASPERDAAQEKVVSQMAACEERLNQYAQAEQHYRQSLHIMQRMHRGEHVDVATSLYNLGMVLKSQGRYQDAATLQGKALAMRQKLLGAEHPDVAKSLNGLALILSGQGKYKNAEILHRKVLAMRQKLFGAAHPDVAKSLNNLAIMLNNQGLYREAATTHRKALAMRQKLLGAAHPDVSQSLNNLAAVLDSQGKHGEAEMLYRQALGMSQELLGAEHPDVATSSNNLANVLFSQGKYGEAEQLYRQALGMRQKLLGVEHPNVATSLNNLALLLHRQGKYIEAETLYRQALGMSQKLLGAEHPDVASSLDSLAAVFYSQGKYGEAEMLFRQALEMRQKLLGIEHPDVASSLSDLALVLSSQGKYAEAEKLSRRALGLWQKLLGAGHPDVALGLNNLGSLLLARGQFAAAVSLHHDAARIREGQIRATFSETRMQALLASTRDEEDTIYGLVLSATADAAVRKLALTTTLLRKGRAVEAGVNANRLLHRNLSDSALRLRFSQWQDVRQRRETLLYSGPGSLQPAEYRARLKDLQLEAESLEAQLSAALPEIRKFQPPDFDAILPAVAKHLPKNGALIEVVWTKPYQAQATGAQARWGAPHYIALLLFSDKRVLSIDLGEAAEVDSRTRALLAALLSPETDPTAAAQALYQKILAPLLPHLATVSELFLSLDGTLNLVPFDALHDGSDYLLGHYRFRYLTSGRDLLRQISKQTPGPALLLANPDFGKADASSRPAGRQNLYRRLAAVSQLPGTQREVQVVAPLLNVTPLLDVRAREEAVRAARSPFVLHIATHGLFMSDISLPSPLDSEHGLRSFSMPPEVRTKNISTPEVELLPGEAGAMNRSALVLAGVAQGDRAASPAQDGLLTAEEARSLDLDGTQLVVLSACETGQGALSAGQGVYGLRRAFLVAGAETLVTSLWRIHDDATGELMGIYYQKLLDKKKPGDRLGSMVEAMQELRARPGRSHPYYWAPFLVIGRDGPLHAPQGSSTSVQTN